MARMEKKERQKPEVPYGSTRAARAQARGSPFAAFWEEARSQIRSRVACPPCEMSATHQVIPSS